MKLLVKILLFVFTVIANVNVANATISFFTIRETTTSFLFQNETPKMNYKVIKNDEANYCKSENNLLD